MKRDKLLVRRARWQKAAPAWPWLPCLECSPFHERDAPIFDGRSLLRAENRESRVRSAAISEPVSVASSRVALRKSLANLARRGTASRFARL